MQTPPALVLDHVRLIDGTGAEPRENMRVTIRGDRIEQIEPASAATGTAAEVLDLTGRTVMPGLIDLHFHMEDDPRLAVRQLVNGVTTFREPGEWIESFDVLRTLLAREQLPGPRMALAGPHIDGERPAYPADAYVARDPDEARLAAETNIAGGAEAIKIYFRLPLASAKAVIDVCRAHHVPCVAHLEIEDARQMLAAGLDGIEHITSFGTSVVPRRRAEQYRQQVLLDNDARRDGRYALFADADPEGPDAQRLYDVLARTHPFVNPTLAVFEVGPGATREGAKLDPAVGVRGFDAMKRLTREVARHGARITLGGHSTAPFAARGEAPWRELELMVDAGLTPLEALTAATGTGAASLYRSRDLGTIETGKLADLVVLDRDPAADIRGIRSVSRVMVGGRWVNREAYASW
jgi:imidazolonepropionase-like amidohydrolase